jgi:hypothetical protein
VADLAIQRIDPRFREGRLCASLAGRSAAAPPPSKTLAAPSSSCSLASSATVPSPFTAARATFALNAAFCFFRGFLSCSRAIRAF